MGRSDLGGILLGLSQPLGPQFIIFYVYEVSSIYLFFSLWIFFKDLSGLVFNPRFPEVDNFIP
jgi:hypothetical protein